MDTYNIYFDVKEGLEEGLVMGLASSYANALAVEGVIQSNDINQVRNKASFAEIPSVHMAIYFHSNVHMDRAFAVVKSNYLNQHLHSK